MTSNVNYGLQVIAMITIGSLVVTNHHTNIKHSSEEKPGVGGREQEWKGIRQFPAHCAPFSCNLKTHPPIKSIKQINKPSKQKGNIWGLFHTYNCLFTKCQKVTHEPAEWSGEGSWRLGNDFSVARNWQRSQVLAVPEGRAWDLGGRNTNVLSGAQKWQCFQTWMKHAG